LLDEIRHAIAAGELPQRNLARAIAALSVAGEPEIIEAIAAGWRYWHYKRTYWTSWRLGDRGTMAEADGPISLTAAHEALALAGLALADPLRSFATQLRCMVCAEQRPLLWCEHDVAQIIELAPLPGTVDDCAIFAADLEGVVRAEAIARALRDRPTAPIVWRSVPPRQLAHSLTAAHVGEQAPLLDLGYVFDPFAFHEDAISLAAPDLTDG